jgi:hypothetical protein
VNLTVSERVTRCVADAIVDGRRLGKITDSLRTPTRFEVRPEGKYGEVFAAAVALCLDGLSGVELSTHHEDGSPREKPDLLLTASSSPIAGIEVRRVDATYAVRTRLFAIQREIATLLADNPQLKPGFPVGITVEYAPTSRLAEDEWRRLSDELLEFFRLRRALYFAEGDYATMFPAESVAAKCGAIVELGHSSRAAILAVAAGSNQMEPYADILQAIEQKRRLSYDLSNPLWLVIEVADPRGPFRQAFEAVFAASPSINPFQRVIVQDGHTHVVLT